MKTINLMYAIAEAIAFDDILCAQVSYPSTKVINGEKIVVGEFIELNRGHSFTQLMEFMITLNLEVNVDSSNLWVHIWLEKGSYIMLSDEKIVRMYIPKIPASL